VPRLTRATRAGRGRPEFAVSRTPVAARHLIRIPAACIDATHRLV